MMQVFTHMKNVWSTPQTWARVIADGVETARISCPDCGVVGALRDHAIDDKGEVKPSVQCDCGYHQFIQLEGWPLVNGGI